MRFLFALAVSFLMAFPFVLGSIDISLDQDYFNIGDFVEISSSISAEESLSAYMRFTVVCGKFSLQYFTTPIDVQEGYRTQIDAPKLKVSSAMEGQCAIKAELLDENGQVSDEGISNSFSVSDGLEIVLATQDLTTLPGASKKIEGVVRGANGQPINADILFTFDDEEYTITTFNGKFIVILSVPPIATSGKHTVKIVATDLDGNKGSASSEIEVIAVPSRIELSVQPLAQNPGMDISYMATITDQAGELLDDSVSITFIQPDGAFIYKGESKSGEENTYTLGQYSAPGEYKVAVAYKNLGSETMFTINSIRDVRMTQQGESVAVENTGNVAYKEEITLVVEGDSGNYIIKEEVNLDPGEVGIIDMSKSVPHGFYTIIIPSLTAQAFMENESVSEEVVLAENVEIHDGRSTFRKTSSSFKGITGNIVGADGVITKHGWTAPLLLVGVVILIGMYYTRDIWLLLLMRRR